MFRRSKERARMLYEEARAAKPHRRGEQIKKGRKPTTTTPRPKTSRHLHNSKKFCNIFADEQ